MEALKRSIFSFTIANLVNKGIVYFPITTDIEEEVSFSQLEGEVSPTLSWKLEESALILRKSVLILVIFELNFSFKMQFLSSGGKTRNFSPFGCLFLSFWWSVFQGAIIEGKLPCPNSWLCVCTIMIYCGLLHEKIDSRFFSRAL